MNRNENQIKYWVDKGIKFYNRPMKSFCRKMMQKSIQHIMKDNTLFLKDSLEL